MSGQLPPGLAETQSGLVVPSDAVAKTQRTLDNETFKKLRRLVREAKDNHLGTVFICTECKQPVELKQVDRIIETASTIVDGKMEPRNAPGGRLMIECKCSEWHVLGL